MRSREDRDPGPISRRRIAEARARVIALYEAWGKPEKAEEWRKRSEADTPKSARQVILRRPSARAGDPTWGFHRIATLETATSAVR